MMETTALGAAIAAGLVVGVWKDVDDLHEINTEGHTIFKPQISHEEREALFCRWNKAVDACRGWTHSDDADDA